MHIFAFWQITTIIKVFKGCNVKLCKFTFVIRFWSSSLIHLVGIWAHHSRPQELLHPKLRGHHLDSGAMWCGNKALPMWLSALWNVVLPFASRGWGVCLALDLAWAIKSIGKFMRRKYSRTTYLFVIPPVWINIALQLDKQGHRNLLRTTILTQSVP